MQDNRDTKVFDIIFEGIARSSGKMRSDIDVRFVTTNETFQIATDEGKTHGGANTAPPPLALFTGALTSCLMTQIRAFAERLRIPVNNVTIHGRLHWRGEQVGSEPYVSAPVSFALDVDIDSDASPEDLTRLLNAAKKGCFVEATLGQINAVRHRLRVGDEWVDA